MTSRGSERRAAHDRRDRRVVRHRGRLSRGAVPADPAGHSRSGVRRLRLLQRLAVAAALSWRDDELQLRRHPARPQQRSAPPRSPGCTVMLTVCGVIDVTVRRQRVPPGRLDPGRRGPTSSTSTADERRLLHAHAPSARRRPAGNSATHRAAHGQVHGVRRLRRPPPGGHDHGTWSPPRAAPRHPSSSAFPRSADPPGPPARSELPVHAAHPAPWVSGPRTISERSDAIRLGPFAGLRCGDQPGMCPKLPFWKSS